MREARTKLDAHKRSRQKEREADVAELKRQLAYDAKTGLFKWKVRSSSRAKVGCIAGYTRIDGYVAIRLLGVRFPAQRLAWLFHHGRWPPETIDHINRCPGDNRITNLRLASPTQQQGNKRLDCRNKSGFRGVFFDKRTRKWTATLSTKKGLRRIGAFTEKKLAVEAYEREAKKYFGEFYSAGTAANPLTTATHYVTPPP